MKKIINRVFEQFGRMMVIVISLIIWVVIYETSGFWAGILVIPEIVFLLWIILSSIEED